MANETIDKNKEIELHSRLLKGDPVAPSEVAEKFIKIVFDRVRIKYRQVDEDLVFDAVGDALLNYIEHPERYKPDQSKLFTYLIMSADGDLKNALEKIKKKNSKEISLNFIEQDKDGRNKLMEFILGLSVYDTYFFETLNEKQLMKTIFECFPDPTDKKLLLLMIEGEKKTSIFARVLGAHNLTNEEQQKIVKQHKDRIKSKLKRLGGKLNAKSK